MFLKGLAATLAASVFVLSASTVSNPTLSRAEELYKRTDFEASLALLNRASGDGATNFLIGRDLFMTGDFKKATEFFLKAAESEPNNSDYQDWLGRSYGRRAETSNPLMAPGFAAKARQAFERSVELNSRNGEALSDLFDYYLEAPGFLGGGYDKAMDVASKIATIDPAEGYFAKAQLARKRKEFQTAEGHLRHAIALAPKQVGRLIDLAKFLASEGRTQESDAVFNQAEQLAPDAPKVWFARADTYIKEKRNLDEAKNLLQKYMHAPITPDDPSKQDASRLLKQAAGGA